MATDLSSSGSLSAWANSLKADSDALFGAGNDEEIVLPIPPGLRSELLQAIEHFTSDESAQNFGQPNDYAGHDSLVERIVEVLDASLADWQASISHGFARSVTQELEDQLKSTQRLNVDLQAQQERLARQLEACQQQQATYLRQHADLRRQRKSVANSLRARKAQLLLEIEQQRQASPADLRCDIESEIRAELESEFKQLQAQLREQDEKVAQLNDQLAESRQALLQLPKQLEETNATWQEMVGKVNDHNDQLSAELNSTREKLRNESAKVQAALGDPDKYQQEELLRLQTELDAAERQLRQRISPEQAQVNTAEIAELRELLELSQIEIEDLSEAKKQLNSAELELESLRAKCAELEKAANAAEEQQAVIELNRQANEGLRNEIESLQIELEQVRQPQAGEQSDVAQQNSDAHVAEMQRLLAEARDELEDLRNQNADLASQLARQQVVGSGSKPHVQFEQESLSWEERKALIIRQLEDETDDSPHGDHEVQAKRVEVDRVLSSTQLEIEKRDREIAELRSIVEHQADTKQGVAIGAAAIAQMFDSDELIAQERQKLKEIQQEWEEKLRQAEIDLSMERARLARERTQLETELENARSQADVAEPEPDGKGKRRKWLEHLGLRDENPQNS